MANDTTMDALRAALEKDGFTLNKRVNAGDPGTDIVAVRGRERVEIEVIGLKRRLPNRANAFYKAVFQVLLLLSAGAARAAIAVPLGAEEGLRKRAKNHGLAWRAFGDRFPGLEIWTVDVEHASYRAIPWADLLL